MPFLYRRFIFRNKLKRDDFFFMSDVDIIFGYYDVIIVIVSV